jgi:hypothetical protein
MQQGLEKVFREQAGWCQRLGSPLYHALLLRIAQDVQSSGICWDVLKPYADKPALAFPLRFLGAVHRLVLEGRFPELARHYPSGGGTADPEAAWQALRRQLELHGLARIPMTEGVQTNEVARCCALLPGFLEIAARTALPLRLLEFGCSAGLNLRWDRFRYETSQRFWGEAASGVVFAKPFVADPPFLEARVHIAERLGCDLDPIDISTDTGRLTLLSFIWPDQLQRLERLARAIDIATTTPAQIERADAVDWLERQLDCSRLGVATVVFHSVVLPYLSEADRQHISQLLEHAGDRATPDAPLARLSMEQGETEVDVNLTLWPGGRRARIATSSFHGPPVKPEAQN